MKLEIGKAIRLRDGNDLTIVANGLLVAPALDAAEILAGEGIQARVLDMHTVKPIDSAALGGCRQGDRRLVVAEEHLAHGGLGSVVAMTLAGFSLFPSVMSTWATSSVRAVPRMQLIEKFGLTAEHVAKAAREVAALAKPVPPR